MTNIQYRIPTLESVKYIVIHHSATKDSSKTLDWPAIRNYHINVNKWKDIGYHFGIDIINNHPEILIGRMPIYIGAHTYGINSISLGICVIGNYDIDTLEPQKEKKLLELLAYLMQMYKLKIDNIIGHRDTYVLYKMGIINYETYQQNIKTCPGLNFSLNSIRQKLTEINKAFSIYSQLLEELTKYDDYVTKNKKILTGP